MQQTETIPLRMRQQVTVNNGDGVLCEVRTEILGAAILISGFGQL